MGKSNVFLTLSEKGFGKEGVVDASQNVLWGSTVLNFDNCPPSTATLTQAGAQNVLGSIEVLDYSFSISQKGSEEGGRPRSVEAVTRTPLTIKRWADSRTPLLFYYCASGKYIKEAKLSVYGTDRSPYLTYTMTYVHISGFEPSGGEELSSETIKLTYGQMHVAFKTERGLVDREWSWVMEMPESVGAV